MSRAAIIGIPLVLVLSGCRWLTPEPLATPTPVPTPWSDPKLSADVERLNLEVARLQQRLANVELTLETLQSTLAELQQPSPTPIPPLPTLTPTPEPSPTPSPTTLTVGTETISLPGDVLFDFDQATIRPAASDLLQQVAETLRQRPGSRILIIGHTDNVGDERYNLSLSLRRATAVKNYLQERLDPDLNHRWTATGYGASQPTADNSTEAGRQRNRRVDIIIAP